MAYQIPSCEPRSFVAGDSVLWTKSLADYRPADGWTLAYRLTNAILGAEIAAAKIVATADTTNQFWNVAIAPADSAVSSGEWRLIGVVTLTATGERHTVFDAVIEVLANAMTIPAASLLTYNEQVLAAIDARVLGRATADQEKIQINGTALERIPIEKLGVLRGQFAAKVWHEQNPGRSNPVHKMRFGHA